MRLQNNWINHQFIHRRLWILIIFNTILSGNNLYINTNINLYEIKNSITSLPKLIHSERCIAPYEINSNEYKLDSSAFFSYLIAHFKRGLFVKFALRNLQRLLEKTRSPTPLFLQPKINEFAQTIGTYELVGITGRCRKVQEFVCVWKSWSISDKLNFDGEIKKIWKWNELDGAATQSKQRFSRRRFDKNLRPSFYSHVDLWSMAICLMGQQRVNICIK